MNLPGPTVNKLVVAQILQEAQMECKLRPPTNDGKSYKHDLNTDSYAENKLQITNILSRYFFFYEA